MADGYDKNAARRMSDEEAEAAARSFVTTVQIGIESVAFTHADQDAVALAVSQALRDHAEFRRAVREREAERP